MLTPRSRLARSVLVGFAALILIVGAAYASQAALGPDSSPALGPGEVESESGSPAASGEEDDGDGAADDDTADEDDTADDDGEEADDDGDSASPEASESPEADESPEAEDD